MILNINLNLGFDLNPDQGIHLNPDPGIDLNLDLGIDLNPDQGIDLNPSPGLDLNPNQGIDLNLEIGIDLNPSPGIDLNPDQGIDLNPSQGIDLNPDPEIQGTWKDLVEPKFMYRSLRIMQLSQISHEKLKNQVNMSKLVLLESLFLINNGWSKLLKNQYVYNPFNTLQGTGDEISSNPSFKESEWYDSGTF